MKTLSRRRLLAAAVPTAAAVMTPAIAVPEEGANAELLALGRKLTPLVAEINAAKGVAKDDHFWPAMFAELSALLEEILEIQPTTLERFAVQVLAVVAVFDDMWDEDNPLQLPSGMTTFFKNACRFAGVPVPA